MLFSKESERIISDLEIRSGVPNVQIKKIFRLLLNEVLCNYHDKSTSVTNIPLIGTLGLEFNGDKTIKKDGKFLKQADVSLVFSSDDHLKRCVGQLEDGDTTDVETYQMKLIAQNLHLEYSND